jgi:hypothetical protein
MMTNGDGRVMRGDVAGGFPLGVVTRHKLRVCPSVIATRFLQSISSVLLAGGD